jgi:hypothetical protein
MLLCNRNHLNIRSNYINSVKKQSLVIVKARIYYVVLTFSKLSPRCLEVLHLSCPYQSKNLESPSIILFSRLAPQIGPIILPSKWSVFQSA